MTHSAVSQRVAALLHDNRHCRAIQQQRRWWSWGDCADLARALDDAVARAELPTARVVIVMREQAPMVATLLAFLARGRCAVLESGLTPDATLCDRLQAAQAGLVIATEDDWARPGLRAATVEGGSGGLSVDPTGQVSVIVERPSSAVPVPASSDEGVAVTLLTSGTTGPPKRVEMTYRRLDATIATRPPGDPSRARGAVINSLPLTSVGGFLGVVHAAWSGRPLALMERFRLDDWLELIAEHQPRRIGAPPAVIAMLLDDEVPAGVLDGVQAFETGSAPLAPDLQVRFEAKFGVPVLPSYGATEFLASVAAWTLEDWHLLGNEKRGSVGRAVPGFSLRIVDDGGRPVGPEQVGSVEVLQKDPADGEVQWRRTNDAGRLDDDGFLWIVGRLDDVIVRGGFKVPANEVQSLLERHPAVAEAAVVGVEDTRVGEVPVAVVAAAPGHRIDSSVLEGWVRDRLEPYKVPVAFVTVDALPRNPMMKVNRDAVREIAVAPRRREEARP